MVIKFDGQICHVHLVNTVHGKMMNTVLLTTAPSSPPANVSAFATSSSSLKIVWDEVPAIHRNGIITMYEIEYTPGEDGVETNTKRVESDESESELDVSPEFRTYLVRMRAYTEIGAGPYSNTIPVLLEEDGM